MLRPNGPPAFKLYFSPEIRGHCRAPRLVQEAFDQLGFRDAYDTVIKYGGRRGQRGPLLRVDHGSHLAPRGSRRRSQGLSVLEAARVLAVKPE